jgi:uncharacterized protein (DUF1330 family)
MHIEPTSEQLGVFATKIADTQPLFMLNLLRFKDRASGSEDVSGVELYGRYAAATADHLRRVGGELMWAGSCDTALIGPDDREWDLVAVVRYPSRAAFLEMVGNADYLATAQMRSDSLADSRLIPCANFPMNG